MERSYKTIINTHFAEHQQMALVSGPRQVGKTTLARSIQSSKNTHYFNWDDFNDRELLLQGGAAIAQQAGLDHLRAEPVLLVFDEIHKFSQWKQLLKGFYDHYAEHCHILVTGSARMDTYKKGGDSLMGRYFNYRLHPFSVGELLVRNKATGLHDLDHDDSKLHDQEIYSPQNIPDTDFDALLRWGGFPEPFMKKNKRFFNRWSRLREQQLLQEDVRTLTNVQELGQLEMLALLLKSQTGQLTSYTSLAKKVRVSVDTIRRWLVILESLYYCYSIRPWTKNVTRSLLKEPKFYLWDWSQCTDTGARNENFIASHLLKAVHHWTDIGLGNYSLYFLRDKEKREVDFLVSRDGKPWFMVEVKSSMNQKLSPNLEVFRKQLNLEQVFQVAIDGEYVDKDTFSVNKPVIVPAKTFLSQLI
jgi:predicted AAA+ superfamily ATPase